MKNTPILREGEIPPAPERRRERKMAQDLLRGPPAYNNRGFTAIYRAGLPVAASLETGEAAPPAMHQEKRKEEQNLAAEEKRVRFCSYYCHPNPQIATFSFEIFFRPGFRSTPLSLSLLRIPPGEEERRKEEEEEGP